MWLETSHMYSTLKAEEKRSGRHSRVMDRHLNSCLHLQTQNVKDDTCLIIREGVPCTKEMKTQIPDIVTIGHQPSSGTQWGFGKWH